MMLAFRKADLNSLKVWISLRVKSQISYKILKTTSAEAITKLVTMYDWKETEQ